MCKEVYYCFSKLLPANSSFRLKFTFPHPGTANPYPLAPCQPDLPALISPGVDSHSRYKATRSVSLAPPLMGKSKKSLLCFLRKISQTSRVATLCGFRQLHPQLALFSLKCLPITFHFNQMPQKRTNIFGLASRGQEPPLGILLATDFREQLWTLLPRWCQSTFPVQPVLSVF